MKICIYGVGAVGGFIGAQLARAGYEINAIAKDVTLRNLQQHGLRLNSNGETYSTKITATDNPETVGVQDLVIVAVKATAMVDIAKKIKPLIGPDTIVMTAMNGVPWWFFDGFGGEYAGMRLKAVDPDGVIAAAIPTANLIGCVVHGSFSLIEPGYVNHVFGNTLIIGEPDGARSERVDMLSDALTKAGCVVNISESIQRDIWFKLWGNMTMNPVSAITGATCDKILDDPLTNRFCLSVMAEAALIGQKIGCTISQSGEERMAVTRKLGAFKTSMLQDVEAGRRIELDALVSAVKEIGQNVGVETPDIDTLLGLSRLFASVRGLYP